MSYKLTKPYTKEQMIAFKTEYNRKMGLKIEETEKALYAIEPWEKLVDDKVIDNREEYEAELAEKERERIGKLTMTKRIFALLLKEYGISYTQLKELISTNENALLEWDLCVELERSNPLLDVMAAKLGVTPEQLDEMFRYANGEIESLTISSMEVSPEGVEEEEIEE